MTKLERISVLSGLVLFIFTAGAGWNSINSRFDRVDEKFADIEDEKAEGLCLTIMKSQIAAIEKNNNSVRNELQRLSTTHCPNVAAWQNASHATTAVNPEQERREYAQAVRDLADINDKLNCSVTGPIRKGQRGYGPHNDRDGDGIACE